MLNKNIIVSMLSIVGLLMAGEYEKMEIYSQEELKICLISLRNDVSLAIEDNVLNLGVVFEVKEKNIEEFHDKVFKKLHLCFFFVKKNILNEELSIVVKDTMRSFSSIFQKGDIDGEMVKKALKNLETVENML